MGIDISSGVAYGYFVPITETIEKTFEEFEATISEKNHPDDTFFLPQFIENLYSNFPSLTLQTHRDENTGGHYLRVSLRSAEIYAGDKYESVAPTLLKEITMLSEEETDALETFKNLLGDEAQLGWYFYKFVW